MKRAMALLIGAWLAMAGCGDDDHHVRTGATPTSSPTAVPVASATATPPPQPPGFENLQHVIVVMQENHSFDNYFGVLPYAAGSP